MGRNITVKVAGLASGIAAARARITPTLEAAAENTGVLVEAVRVRLTALDPRSAVLAQAAAEVDGRRIRVQRVATGPGAASERLAEALRTRIAEVTGEWCPRLQQRSAASPVPGPRSGDAPRIDRVKSPELVWCSPDTAARTMDAMDYDIHLFTDPDTETDAAVFRAGPTGYQLARTDAGPPPHSRNVAMTLSEKAAELLTDAQALARAAAAELPYLFYADPETGRGRILYRRFTGGFGLIRPAGDAFA
ncbi:sigma 54 modulation/S30EA ribosomal C-terminal domain-containing protein [Yinghuangia soli]|uniref:Sigma 54 modulation/S30EA ribosomal C-terminal domain-containing protein n=1 Tax=Yinghuangia soli TaxID=2908204 RepID=A0AA41TXS9_9ACTN|nr:sigma 54 modulation/S30EA ribosomal C-terminal domain-containing protein [Yinghuangia soli]MCF2525646.1 sigma 54 modulation/S30EA ribosomal C-terminal domain-containing protein [Yinghuangia soli]